MAKVVRFHELGGPEVLRLEEITFEDPAPGELRLKVGAIGLNRLEAVINRRLHGNDGSPTYESGLRKDFVLPISKFRMVA
jgi:NADPH:quinone reductase-like Zn-dependent oxidoreductase